MQNLVAAGNITSNDLVCGTQWDISIKRKKEVAHVNVLFHSVHPKQVVQKIRLRCIPA